MAQSSKKAPANRFGITDLDTVEELAGALATMRLGELENSDPLTSFTHEDLMRTHNYILQDIYPWAGELRTEEVGAMGLTMCRAEYVAQELDRVFKDIQRRTPPQDNQEAAVQIVADHWGEMTMVHPFRDGNSRTQRIFFEHMLRHAGWAIDWTVVNAHEVHAARYVAAATANAAFLADALRPGVYPVGQPAPEKQQEEDRNYGATSAEIFHNMMHFRRTNPGQSFHNTKV